MTIVHSYGLLYMYMCKRPAQPGVEKGWQDIIHKQVDPALAVCGWNASSSTEEEPPLELKPQTHTH